MFRYRRYRVFLAVTVAIIVALYHFGAANENWREQGSKVVDQIEKAAAAAGAHRTPWEPNPQVAHETFKLEIDVPAAKISQPQQTPPPIGPNGRPIEEATPMVTVPPQIPSVMDPNNSGGKHGVEADDPGVVSVEPLHWSKQSEHFPLPSKSMAHLPTAKPKKLAKIQRDFKRESESDQAEREQKLEAIRNVFKRSWGGYRKFAWLQDELKPVTNGSKNPFAGWGATLVDSLDTLWMMGLKEEFAEAVDAVKKIDFTTTPRADIPLFETTIRYLGGLLGAYDVSEKKYKVLLDKAVELAEILYSAFDTPNRMPDMYYYWRPDFAINPHRASNRVVLAEIGSLSMEFTRLSQLTGDQKYYDAINRITDYLEDFQDKTRLPGMWPTYIDASGCKRIDYMTDGTHPAQAPLSPFVGKPSPERLRPEWAVSDTPPPDKPQADPRKDPSQGMVKEQEKATGTLGPDGQMYYPLDVPSPLVVKPGGKDPNFKPVKEEPFKWDINAASTLKKRADDLSGSPVLMDLSPVEDTDAPIETKPVCEEQGFVSSSNYGSEEFTLGGMSDSTYEYLPKQFLLLGGLVTKYRTMYEKSADTFTKHLFFRPMLPDENDVLVSGKVHVPSEPTEHNQQRLEPEQAHLTCFAGGMLAMSAKLFDRPKDLELAEKLTHGCILSYNATTTGIMPEAFELIACADAGDCHWNETLYYDALDPGQESRATSYRNQLASYQQSMQSASAWYEEQMQAWETPAPVPVGQLIDDSPPVGSGPAAEPLQGVYKRQVAPSEPSAPAPAVPLAMAEPAPRSPQVTKPEAPAPSQEEATKALDPDIPPQPSRTKPVFPYVYSPVPPLTHEEYVKARIEDERLPGGFLRMNSKVYILRPELIESLFYLHRITGDPSYRAAGWQIFKNIEQHTATPYGNSAIDDVTKKTPQLENGMESFWLAETLKYFWLLFCDEDEWNLDAWVSNTEAHFFKRPGT